MQQKFTVVVDTKKAYQPTQADVQRIVMDEVRKRVHALAPDQRASFSVHLFSEKAGE